jgi:hypothetical protein
MYSLSLLSRLDRILDTPRALLWLLGAASVAYTLAYLGHPILPGNSSYPEGWWGWWDQGQYLKCTTALAKGALDQESYFYPLGYSLVAVPFYFLAPKHAFFLPNLVFVIGSTWAFYGIARRLVRPTTALLLMIAFVVFYRGMLRDTLVVPWNTIPTHFLAYLILYLTAFRRPSERDVLVASVCLAVIYPFKVPEFVCLLPSVLVAIASLGDRKRVLRAGLILALAVTVIVTIMLTVNFSVFGQFRTKYELIQQGIGVMGYPPLWKIYLLLVSGGPVFRENQQMLLSHAPWLLLTLPGAVRLFQRYRFMALGTILGIALCFATYLNYNDLFPTNFYRFSLIHYFVWTLPLLALITYVGIREAWKTRLGRWSLCSIPLLLALICSVTLREKTVGTIPTDNAHLITIPARGDRPIDWIVLHGARGLPTRMATDGREWQYATDFQSAQRNDGVGLLPSKRVTGRASEITPRDPEEIRWVEFGELVWTWRWSPKWLLYQWTRRFAPIRASLLGKVAGIDVAGPGWMPDGRPDEVIRVEVPMWVTKQIKDWQIELEDNRGHWFTSRTAQRDLPIVINYLPAGDGARGTSIMQLCFMDNGNFETAVAVSVRGLDPLGQVVIESTAIRR